MYVLNKLLCVKSCTYLLTACGAITDIVAHALAQKMHVYILMGS